MKHKKTKIRVMLIVMCIIFVTTSISSFARERDGGGRRNKKNKHRTERRWRWWDEEEDEDVDEDEDTIKDDTLDEDTTKEDTSKKDTAKEDTTTEDADNSNSTVDTPTASEIENSTNNGDIGYKKVSESASSAVASATVCSSASALSSAINSAKAGSVIYVKGGTYSGVNLSIDAQGSSSGYITIKNYPGETVTFKNSTVEFGSSAKYIKLEGFIFKDYTPNDDWGACISLCGGASNIQIRNNEISNIKCRGTGEVGVNCIVLTGDSSSSINNVTIENNYVYNCNTGWSEAITTDGNVENCVIKNNTVDNTGNIGIDLCGNFSWTGTVGSDTNQSRNILVTKNKVMNCNSAYATSAGLYCDGGRDNTFAYNIVYNSQCGIELGAEEKGADVKNFTVNNNIIVNCGRAIGAGAYLSTGAKHYNTNVYDNTIICNETSKWGENYAIYLERTTGFTFKNNVVYAKTSKTSFIETSGSASYTLSGNTWYVEGGNGSKPSADSTGVFKNPNIAGLDNMLKGIF